MSSYNGNKKSRLNININNAVGWPDCNSVKLASILPGRGHQTIIVDFVF
jgi:hypothetical protein